MYLGQYQLGDWVDFNVRTTNASRVVTQPHVSGDRAPTVHVYQGSTHIESFRMPVLEPSAITGLFYGRFQLDSSYSTGNCLIAVTWSVSSQGFFGHKEYRFAVVPGGSASGAVMAMEELDRPTGLHVVGEYDTGVLFQGRNPR